VRMPTIEETQADNCARSHPAMRGHTC
jgi:hypothetical protein